MSKGPVFQPQSVSEHEWETLVKIGQDQLARDPTGERVREIASWLSARAGLSTGEMLQLRVEIAQPFNIVAQESDSKMEDLDVYGILEKNKKGALEDRVGRLEEEFGAFKILSELEDKGIDGLKERIKNLENRTDHFENSRIDRRMENLEKRIEHIEDGYLDQRVTQIEDKIEPLEEDFKRIKSFIPVYY